MGNEIDHKVLFDTMPVPRFLVKAVEGSGYAFVDGNEESLSYFDLSKKELVDKSLDDVLDKEVLVYFQQSLEAAESQKKPVSFRIPSSASDHMRFNGFWVNPVLDAKKNIAFLDIMAIPVGLDSNSLQRERDDAISLLTSVFDVSEVGIVVTDRHQRVIRVNDSFVRIYGWSRDELIGREFVDVVAPDEREQVRSDHDEFIRSGIRSSGEMRILREDKTMANALFTTAALELSHGRRFQVTTIMDITLRKQMEITLRRAKEQADSANHAKSQFLANMSHELRTPLNAIIGFSEMMIKETFGPLGDKKYSEYLDDIHLSARHLLEIINEVLDMSKIEAGRVELDEELFNIGQLIDSVSRMMASRAFSSGLKITETVKDNLPPLYADHRLVRQILINLLGNAVKYAREGTAIDIKAFLVKGDALRVVVSDTGIGIPKDRIAEALEPFGQVSKRAETSNPIQGTGLGLPLAKAMMELHGGVLTLESDVGKGTIVTIEFPSTRVGEDKKKSSKDKQSPMGGFKKKAVH